MPPKRPDSKKKKGGSNSKSNTPTIDEEEQKKREEEGNGTKDFTDMAFVENCLSICKKSENSVMELIDFITKEMKIPNYMLDLRSSIIVDFHIYNIEFAKYNSFNVEKASAFLTMMEDIRTAIESGKLPEIQRVESSSSSESRSETPVHNQGDDAMQQQTNDIETNESITPAESVFRECSVDECMDFFKKKMIELTCSREKEVEISEEEVPPNGKDGKKKVPRKSTKSPSLLGKKKKKEETTNDEPKRTEIITIPPLLSVDDVREITNYLINGLFKHFKLYKYVFTQSQAVETHSYEVFLESVDDRIAPLAEFMEEKDYIEMKEREKRRIEGEERKKREEEEAFIRAQIEEERLRKQKLEEERNAPKLSRKELEEVAAYLKYHIERDLVVQREAMVSKISELQEKLEQTKNVKTTATPSKASKK